MLPINPETLWLISLTCVLITKEMLHADAQIVSNGTIAENTKHASSKMPNEIQKAICTVTAGDVKASAEAVTTNTLRGVCGSDEMRLAFRNLETKLYDELYEIKSILEKLAKSNGYRCDTVDEKLKIAPRANSFENKPNGEQSTENEQQDLSRLSKQESNHSCIQREHEITKFNNTIVENQDFKLFKYYWKLENFTNHIINDMTETIHSPLFSIKGRAFFLKCTFNHLHRQFLHLQLSNAPLPTTNNVNNNIIIDIGGLFKEIKFTKNSVSFKHKISILDQNDDRMKDLSSQELSNFGMGFYIPNSALLGSSYIKQDSILIQIILYL